MAEATNNQNSTQANDAIGNVAVVKGTVQAQAQDGTLRTLDEHSPVFANDRILTGDNGAISIVFGDAAQSQIDLGRNSDVLIDEDVYQPATSDIFAETTAEVEQIQEALLEGDFDPTLDLEAAAAGQDAGPANAGGGIQNVRFELTGDEVIPESGAETTGPGFDFVKTELDQFIEPVEPILAEVVVEEIIEEGLPAAEPTAELAIDPTPEPVPEPIPEPTPEPVTLSVTATGGTVSEGALDSDDVAADDDIGTDPASDAESTTGQIVISTGGDPYVLTVGGTPILADNTPVTGDYGTLLVNTDGSWIYTLNDNTLAHDGINQTGADDTVTGESFAVSVSDDSGTAAPATGNLVITIEDDGPVAIDTPAVVTVNDGEQTADAQLSDLIKAAGADGATVTEVNGQPIGVEDLRITGQYGDLVISGGSYSYEATDNLTVGSPAGPDNFIFTITDGDGDTATVTVGYSVADNEAPSITVTGGTVSEGALDSDDVAADDDIGTDPASDAESTTGQIVISTGGDPYVLTVGGTPILADNTPVTGDYGTLLVNTDGSWSYTLNDNTLAHDGINQTGADDTVTGESFAVSVSDDSGTAAPATGNLVITIEDDGPVAIDTPAVVTVNDGEQTADAQLSDLIKAAGADGATVTEVNGQPIGVEDLRITGQYGDLVISGGSYRYEATDNLAVASPAGPDNFIFTITDGDGDTATVTVGYSVADNEAPSITVTGGTVSEGALDSDDVAADDDIGTDPASDAESTTGQIVISTGGDPYVLTVGGTPILADNTPVTGDYGTLLVNTDGSWIYTLNDNTLAHDGINQTGADDTVTGESFAVSVSDDSGTAAPATGNLVITIEDDGPVITEVSDGHIANEPLVEMHGIFDSQYGADGAGYADLTRNVTELDTWEEGNNYADSGFTSNGNTVYYYVDPLNTNVLQAVTVTDPNDINDSTRVFTLTINTLTDSYDIKTFNSLDATQRLSFFDEDTSDSTSQEPGIAFLDVLNPDGTTSRAIVPTDELPPAEKIVETYFTVTSYSSDDGSDLTVNGSNSGVGIGPNVASAQEVMVIDIGEAGLHDGLATGPIEFSVFQVSNNPKNMQFQYTAYNEDGDKVNLDGSVINPGDSIQYTKLLNESVDASSVDDDKNFSFSVEVDASVTKVEIESTTGSWKLTNFEYTEQNSQIDIVEEFEVTITDADGDTATDIIEVEFDGDNTMVGTEENDVFVGGPEDEFIYGEGGADEIFGGGGNDQLIGGDGADTLIGGDGDDTLVADIVTSYGVPETPGDTIIVEDGEQDIVIGGEGAEVAGDKVNENIDLTSTEPIVDGPDTFSEIEVSNDDLDNLIPPPTDTI